LDVPARNRFFDDEGFEFLTLIALGSTAYRMAEVFSGGEGRRPLVIFNNGSDGTVVGMLTVGLDEAARRGYHAPTFDGPGQPGPV
jgi:hypothetical protein